MVDLATLTTHERHILANHLRGQIIALAAEFEQVAGVEIVIAGCGLDDDCIGDVMDTAMTQAFCGQCPCEVGE